MAALEAERAEQRAEVEAELAQHGQLKETKPWYVLEARWWQLWQRWVGWPGCEPATTPPPCIDNSALLLPADPATNFAALRPGLQEKADFELLPQGAWKALKRRYGGGPGIARYVFAVGPTRRLRVALYPVPLMLARYEQPAAPGEAPVPSGTVPLAVPPEITVKQLRQLVAAAAFAPPHRVRLPFCRF